MLLFLPFHFCGKKNDWQMNGICSLLKHEYLLKRIQFTVKNMTVKEFAGVKMMKDEDSVKQGVKRRRRGEKTARLVCTKKKKKKKQ